MIRSKVFQYKLTKNPADSLDNYFTAKSEILKITQVTTVNAFIKIFGQPTGSF
jgi:hypothetical protein